jgi:hypothetical protein
VARTRQQHSQDSTYAAHIRWGGVADRTEQLRNAHNNSPSGIIWSHKDTTSPGWPQPGQVLSIYAKNPARSSRGDRRIPSATLNVSRIAGSSVGARPLAYNEKSRVLARSPRGSAGK